MSICKCFFCDSHNRRPFCCEQIVFTQAPYKATGVGGKRFAAVRPATAFENVSSSFRDRSLIRRATYYPHMLFNRQCQMTHSCVRKRNRARPI